MWAYYKYFGGAFPGGRVEELEGARAQNNSMETAQTEGGGQTFCPPDGQVLVRTWRYTRTLRGLIPRTNVCKHKHEGKRSTKAKKSNGRDSREYDKRQTMLPRGLGETSTGPADQIKNFETGQGTKCYPIWFNSKRAALAHLTLCRAYLCTGTVLDSKQQYSYQQTGKSELTRHTPLTFRLFLNTRLLDAIVVRVRVPVGCNTRNCIFRCGRHFGRDYLYSYTYYLIYEYLD